MRAKLTMALAAVLALVATTASAGHDLAFDVTLADNSAGAHSDTTAYTDYGTDQPESGTTHLAPGFEVNHAGTSDSPDDGEKVGEIQATAEWKATLCSEQTMTLDAEWVEPVESGAPADTVAQIKVTGLSSDIDVWVIDDQDGDSYHAGAHDDLYVEDFGDDACSGSAIETSMTTYGTTDDGDVVSTNPCSSGDHTIHVEYDDKSSPSQHHDDSDTVSISGSC